MPILKVSSKRRGFTLLEVLIVLGILAGLAAIGIPKLFKKSDNNFRKVARQMGALTKELRNRARLKNATVRLVIDMTAEPHRYWVEIAQGGVSIASDLYDDKKKDKDKDAPPSPFHRDELLTKKDKELPGDVFFEAVETINTKTPITQGIAYIHYFPEGFVETSVIQITNRRGLTWSMVLSPLTGQADILEEAKFLKDLKP